MIRPIAAAAAASATLALAASAQTPFTPHSDLWVTDTTNDRIARVADLNYDGDYNDVGESTIFYDDTIGPWLLSNNAGLVSLPDGGVFVSDTSTDQILLLHDLDGNGDANGLNESTLYFATLTNANGIVMDAANNVFFDNGVLWVAVANSSGGNDCILRLEDLNADDDAMDAGESLQYLLFPGTAALPQDVRVGADGNVYYLEICATGAYAKGIYKLVDLDGSGAIDLSTEVFPFFIPAALAGTGFYWSMALDPSGNWYLPDAGNDVIWKAKDADGSGSVDPLTEAKVWWDAPGTSYVWDCAMGTDGYLYVAESQDNDRILQMRDSNGDDLIDPLTEVLTTYDQALALGAPIGVVRGLALDAKFQAPSEYYCTAQVNTLGCMPTVSYAGWPSASWGSGYLLSAANVRSDENGIMFYGVTGRWSGPFHGGTLCVAPPQIRTGVQNSGGTVGSTDCTGQFSLDFNAWIAGGSNPALVAGTVVDAQFWSRDPGSPLGDTNVTSAIEFCILR